MVMSTVDKGQWRLILRWSNLFTVIPFLLSWLIKFIESRESRALWTAESYLNLLGDQGAKLYLFKNIVWFLFCIYLLLNRQAWVVLFFCKFIVYWLLVWEFVFENSLNAVSLSLAILKRGFFFRHVSFLTVTVSWTSHIQIRLKLVFHFLGWLLLKILK